MADVCTIEEEGENVGQYGEPLHGWRVVISNIKCRVLPVKGGADGIDMVGAQEALVDSYVLSCPVGTPFAVDQRVRINDGVYLVEDVMDNVSDAMDAKALIRRVRV